ALDVSGCLTDQGASLVVESRANSNSATAKKSSANNSVEGEEPTEEAVKEVKEKEQKEQYRLHLLRESKNAFLKKIYKPLRPSRSFEDIKTYYGTMDTNVLIREKKVPFTLAFVYVKLADESINEYRIISRGSLYAESFKDIVYKDEKNVERAYIPLYDGEPVAIFYSNIQLSSDQTKRTQALNNFTGVAFDPSDTNKDDKSFFLKDPSSINTNEISEESFKLQKEYDPLKEHEKKVKEAEAEGKSTDFKLYPLDSVATIVDPIGEAEDLFNIYERSYKTSFSNNDIHLNQLKKKNSYLYAVSNQIDYFYVSKDEQSKYDADLKKLKRLYRKLADEVCEGKFANKINKGKNDITALNKIIDPAYHTALNYLNQVKFINKSFFKNVLDGVVNNRGHRESHLYNEDQFIISANNLTTKYVGLVTFESVKRENVFIRRRYDQGRSPIRDVNYGYLILDNEEDDKYTAHQKSAQDMLALLVFALFFSKEYEAEAKATGVYDTAKEFYITLKNARPLPAIGDDNIKNVQNMITSQKHSYAKICSRENKLLDQFENIDTINQECSFDTANIKSPQAFFNNLYIPKSFSEFYKAKLNPKDILTKGVEVSQTAEFKQIFKAYEELKEFDSTLHMRESLNTMMGLLFTFMDTKSRLDAEAVISSPFTNKAKHIVSLLEHYVDLKNELSEEEFYTEIFTLPIHKHFVNALNSHILHSLIQGDKNEQGFSERQGNAQALLTKYKPDKNEIKEFDLSNLLSDDFDISEETKKTIADYYGALTKIESYASKTVAVADEYAQANSNSFDDILSKEEVKKTTFQNTPQYKAITSTIKSLSIFVAGMNVAIAVFDKNKLKGKDILPLAIDTYATLETFSKVMPKTRAAVLDSVKSLLSAEELARIASFKVLAHAGMVAVAITAYYDVTELQEGDVDGGVAILTKNITVIALLAAPIYLAAVPGIGWVAALGILAVEVAWELYIKDVFVDTPIESYIMKSLLFHKHDDESMLAPMMFPVGYAVYRFFSDNPYQVQLFSETINAKHKDMIEGFSDMQELQEYLGDNQEKYEELFNNALQYELTALKSVALGYKVDILDPIDKDYYGMPQTLQTTIKIPKEVMR
ncbi:MAG: hypothetical protein P8Y16_00910, partial [Sulfurimonas sp.]